MLKKARVTTEVGVPDTYAIPEVPEKIKRDRWDRPLIRQPDGTEVAYTRASTLGKAIEDTYHLDLWKQRCVAFGLSRRKDLLAAAASIETNEGEDRKALQEICSKAHEAAKGDAGANIGTALHLLSERKDKGEDLSWLPDIIGEAMDYYAEAMECCEVLATEIFVVCDELEAAGSFDRVVRLKVDLEFTYKKQQTILPAGTILILDLKTGKKESAKYWGADYGAQQTVYANGVPYGPNGRMTWKEVLGEDVEPTREWALILHVPGDSPQDTGFVIVDLEIGAEMAGLAREVKEMRKRKGLMLDAYPVYGPVEPEEPVVTDPRIIKEVNEQFEKDLDKEMEGWCPECDGPAQCPAGSCCGNPGTPEQQAQYRDEPESIEAMEAAGGEDKYAEKLQAMVWLKEAPDEEALWAVYEMYTEIWDDDLKRMARVRQREFDNMESK